MNFEVQMYGEPTLLSDVLSKRRVRIFYKYENRNLTYITDDFAEELISSLPYTPVKGIYEDQDFQAHGAVNSEGKIYGIVPQDMNFAWEPHLDEDGIERVYACCDVYIFSALYPEAEAIKFKSQSMELFRPTLKYHHEIIRGQRYTVFDHGCFIGLQVLGDNFEPCFEGAAFYSLGSSEVEKLRDSINDVIEKIKSYSYKGEERMTIPNFKLSDDQKFSALWTLLNPNYNEEQGWAVNCSIGNVYDNYCIFFNYEDGNTYRAYYTKDDEADSVKIDSVEKVFILDVTEAEKATLDTLRKLNGDTYELVSEVLDNAQDTLEKYEAISEEKFSLESQIQELNDTISTLNIEKENAQDTYNLLTEEVENLREFKHNVETQEKMNVIGEYENLLSAEVLAAYSEKIDTYTAIELDMNLAYELKKSSPSVFSNGKKKNDEGLIPKEPQYDGVAAILSNYRK